MFLLSSCQQFVKNFQTRGGDDMVLHAWTMGTKYLDRKRGKTYPGKTKVYILGEDKIRMDVFDPFGFVTLGTLIINNGEMRLKTIEGVDYKGLASGEKIENLLKVKVSPKDLFSIFLQSGFEDKHWSCAVDENSHVLSDCMSGLNKIKIEWSGLMAQKGTKVLIEHPKAKLVFKVKGYKSHEKYDERLFKL